MVRYVSLLRFTEKGSAGIKDSTQRAESFNLALAGTGVDIVGQYWTMGSYDGVLILEAASEEKILHYLAALSATGAVQPETMRAFDADEFNEIVES
jgi:uncharacterized protein with GYD domain